MKFTELPQDEQVKLMRQLAYECYRRGRELMIALEHERGVRNSYGTSVMTDADRMRNRIAADWLMTDQGLSLNDLESRQWVNEVLTDQRLTGEKINR